MTIEVVRARLLAGFAALLLAGVAHAAAPGEASGARFVDLWGPEVGAALPVLDAVDHSGERRRLADLAGQRGLLLFLVRSADW